MDSPIMDEVKAFGTGKEPGEQQSLEWLMERVGFCTASRFADVISVTAKGKPSASRQTYLLELVTERLLNRPGDYYFSNAMQWGLEQEAAARMAYEAHTGAMVAVPGFKRHPTIEWCGASSDGLIDEDGTIEIKCPANSRNGIMTLLEGMPSEHMAQVQGGLWVHNRAYCDFINYDPRMPAHLQLYIQRIPRDETYIALMEVSIVSFLAEVAALHAKLMNAAERTAI